MTDGKIAALQAELTALRTQIQDLTDRAGAAWQRMGELRRSGGMLPDAEAESAAQQIVHQRYQAEIAKLEQRQRHLTDQMNDLTNERREFIRVRQETQKYLDLRAADYEKYTEAEKRAKTIAALDPGDSRLRDATRYAISEFSGILEGYRNAESQLRDYNRRIAEIGE